MVSYRYIGGKANDSLFKLIGMQGITRIFAAFLRRIICIFTAAIFYKHCQNTSINIKTGQNLHGAILP